MSRVWCRSVCLLFCVLCCFSCTRPDPAPVYAPGHGQPTVAKPQAAAAGGQTMQKNRLESTEASRRNYHVIVKGDTLYSIAWRYDLDYLELADWNELQPPYLIYQGRVLRLIPPPSARYAPALPVPAPSSHGPKQLPAPAMVQGRDEEQKRDDKVEKRGEADTETASSPRAGAKDDLIWRWPTPGKLVKLDTPTGKKGINLAGSIGQAVMAAADGQVVYSGSGLNVYGKLIIIRHSDTYLSAYAYNRELMVKEGEQVDAGDQISTMGEAPAGSGALLHFEIRKRGKPVDPLRLLPKKNSA